MQKLNKTIEIIQFTLDNLFKARPEAKENAYWQGYQDAIRAVRKVEKELEQTSEEVHEYANV